ncbi:MAG: hypothetical protein ACD_78C00458G0003 [uncultured bacterium (gcode 4)]|uniref:Anti-sigma factor antagonist n=1 Tax=uncultured bacterium (gcode 4) TaxID=1234023 RepID=K1XWG0_9BACT|nr:MAG: hypothetical protein ACD_78C00458G0003 [uncultured bacterium (gcode 4)]
MKPVFTVQLSGQLDQTSILEYNTSIMELLTNNTDPFVLLLEMSGVDYMNSTAIGYIADWYNTLSENWGEIVVVGAQENIKDTFDIVGLANRVSLYDTIDEFKADFVKNQTA